MFFHLSSHFHSFATQCACKNVAVVGVVAVVVRLIFLRFLRLHSGQANFHCFERTGVFLHYCQFRYGVYCLLCVRSIDHYWALNRLTTMSCKRERDATSSRHKIQNNGTAYLNYCLWQTDEWFHFIFVERIFVPFDRAAQNRQTSNTIDSVCSISKIDCNLAAIAGVLHKTRCSPFVQSQSCIYVVAMAANTNLINWFVCVRSSPINVTTLL